MATKRRRNGQPEKMSGVPLKVYTDYHGAWATMRMLEDAGISVGYPSLGKTEDGAYILRVASGDGSLARQLLVGFEPTKRHINPPKRDEIVRRQKKPAFKGSFIGQAITSQERVDTGKFRYIPMPPEIAARYYREGKEPPEKLKVSVVETQTITHWLWDGRDWVRPEDYNLGTNTPYSSAVADKVKREFARKEKGRARTEAYRPPAREEAPSRPAPKMTAKQKALLASFAKK
jgi:hypothetical protein